MVSRDMATYRRSLRDRGYGDYISDNDDFFSSDTSYGLDDVVAEEKKAETEITPEYEYLETCFLDFKDVYKLKIKSKNNNKFDVSIKVEEMKSSTFGSHKDYFNNISENMNNIDESLLKFKLKYPHSNINVSVNDKSIDLKIEI